MRVQSKASVRLVVSLLGLVVVLAACGGGADGDSGDATDVGSTGGDDQSADQDSSGSSGDTSSDGGDGAAAGGTSEALATLMVGSHTYIFEGNEWTYCEIGGLFPANVEFQTEQDKRAGNWVQFIDRGDGGINFSAILVGEEYTGTGSGEADEITSNGLAYTGTLNRGGEIFDTVLEVSC